MGGKITDFSWRLYLWNLSFTHIFCGQVCADKTSEGTVFFGPFRRRYNDFGDWLCALYYADKLRMRVDIEENTGNPENFVMIFMD